MQFFFYLILLSCIFVEYSLTINDTDLIRCTSQCSETILTFAQPSVFSSQCQYEYAFACGIEYKIDYDKEEITITFQATNETESLEDQKPSEFIVQTINLALSTNSSEPTYVTRKYGCNANDDCAKQSYLNAINYFVTDGPGSLDFIRAKLQNDSFIIGNGSRRRCIESDQEGATKPVKCPTGLCFLEQQSYHLNNEQHYKLQRCDLENRPVLNSEIEHHTPSSNTKEREYLKYRCNKNVCNRVDITDKIKNLLSGYTNGTLRIHGGKSISGKNGGLIITQTISLVSFLFLIQLFI